MTTDNQNISTGLDHDSNFVKKTSHTSITEKLTILLLLNDMLEMSQEREMNLPLSQWCLRETIILEGRRS